MDCGPRPGVRGMPKTKNLSLSQNHNALGPRSNRVYSTRAMTRSATNKRRQLPLGIQSLARIREENCYYVDKTPFALRLIEQGSYYFLSRPRRFGKSLFLDTLAELFEGNRPLFEGLYADDHWDWEQKYPVIRISFGDGVLKSREALRMRIEDQLLQNAQRLGLSTTPRADYSGWFSAMIREARSTHGRRVVLLIDEYDKPILDNIEDATIATEMREGLKDIYSVIKGADPHLKFVLLTGVSKFSKVSLFSGLNNLTDITLDPQFSALCGYTEEDVDTIFAPELEGLDRELIRTWYNGYNWLGTAVYNPFDLLLLFRNREFRSWWYETGTPTFLLKLLRERPTFIPDLGRRIASNQLLSTFDVGNIPTEALMFQAGYLTIAERQEPVIGSIFYLMRYPNLEVRKSLHESLLADWSPSAEETVAVQSNLLRHLLAHDLEAIGELLRGFFASIPHQWFIRTPIAQYEGYYASVFYAFFASLGLDITVEESSNAGRLDMALRFQGRITLYEFKVVDDEPTAEGNSALAQIVAKGYANKYRHENLPISLVGVEFSQSKRAIVAWDFTAPA